MSHFIKKTFFLLLPLLLLLPILELCIRQIPNSFKYKNEYVLSHSIDIKTLILGSSHTYFGINPEFLPQGTFNLANVAQDLERDCFLLNSYINKCENLQTVILPISYHTLFWNMENTAFMRMAYYGIYMGYNEYKYELELRNNGGKKLFKYLSGKDVRACNDLGFGTDYLLENKPENWRQWDRIVKGHTSEDMGIFDENLEYLEMIVSLCREQKIRLILLTLPTLSCYYSNLNENQLNLMYKTIDSITDQNYNVSYYNFLTDKRFVDDDFFDLNHLSNVGAEKMSRIIADIL